jgi:hypothetical protein
LKRNASHRVLVEVRLDFDDEGTRLIPFDDQGLFKAWQFGAIEGNVNHCSPYGKNLSSRLC